MDNLATSDGARVTQWSRNDQAQQQWQFVDSGNGHYRLRSRHSNKVPDVHNSSTDDSIVQRADNNAANQQFQPHDLGGRCLQLINRKSGKASKCRAPPPTTAPASSNAAAGTAPTAVAAGARQLTRAVLPCRCLPARWRHRLPGEDDDRSAGDRRQDLFPAAMRAGSVVWP
ncbi:RICIN domain-containing protein [Streptomyces sp. KM273126]|uniref:RICIN domain-containing protein n=1 Tax=Streptomyces sp. KM273126 TaxID=2545247 RepID=UPI00286810DF|nr:RICIN domain-containing protein [Streptomyces sp. KM273126]